MKISINIIIFIPVIFLIECCSTNSGNEITKIDTTGMSCCSYDKKYDRNYPLIYQKLSQKYNENKFIQATDVQLAFPRTANEFQYHYSALNSKDTSLDIYRFAVEIDTLFFRYSICDSLDLFYRMINLWCQINPSDYTCDFNEYWMSMYYTIYDMIDISNVNKKRFNNLYHSLNDSQRKKLKDFVSTDE